MPRLRIELTSTSTKFDEQGHSFIESYDVVCVVICSSFIERPPTKPRSDSAIILTATRTYQGAKRTSGPGPAPCGPGNPGFHAVRSIFHAPGLKIGTDVSHRFSPYLPSSEETQHHYP